MLKRKILLLAAILALCTPTLRAQDDDEDFSFLAWLFSGGNVSVGFVYDGREEQWGRGLRLQSYTQLGDSRWSLSVGCEGAVGKHHLHVTPLLLGVSWEFFERTELELIPIGMTFLYQEHKKAGGMFYSMHFRASHDLLPTEYLRLGPYAGCAWLPGASRLLVELGVRAAIGF